MLLCTVLVCQQLMLDSFAEEKSTEPQSPPPELIILEGEEWVPDAVDPLSISTYGYDDDCRHNGASPPKYRYIGAVRGNTQYDVFAVDILKAVISVSVPGTQIVLDIISALENIFPGDELEGDYYRYQYIYEVGPDPNLYWFHTVYSCATKNGEYVGTACYATYSPKKPVSDPFQD